MTDYSSDSNVITDSVAVWTEPAWWSLDLARGLRQVDYEIIKALKQLNSAANGSTEFPSISAGTFSFSGNMTGSSASPVFTVGAGTGSPVFVLNKVGTGSASLIYRIAGSINNQFGFVWDSAETLNFRHYDGSGNTLYNTAYAVDGTWDFPTTVTVRAGNTAGQVGLRIGSNATDGIEFLAIDEVVSLAVAAASFDLTSNVPAGAVILSVQANLQTAISATTAVKVGIGVAADPDKYGKTTGLTQNLKVDTIPAHAVLAGAEDIQVYAVDTAGAAAGTIGGTGESVRVRITYMACNSLANT